MGSLLFGGDDSRDEPVREAAQATTQRAVEESAEPPNSRSQPELPEAVVPEAAAPDVDDLDAKNAAAARLALIEAERAVEEQRQRELDDDLERRTQANLQRLLEEQGVPAERAAALAAAARQAERDGANRENATATPPASTEPGTLRLIVLPFGDIYVNGALQARDMSRFELPLSPGTYQVRLENATRQTVDTSIVVRAGEPTSVRVTLPSRND